MTTLRELLDRGELMIGGWCGIPSGFSAELMGRCDWDWVCLDTQHGLIGYDQASVMLETLSITRKPAFVRVPWNQPDHIMKSLDAGAQGIIVPMVNDAAEARHAVEAVKFPPLGWRSWGPVRASFDVEGYSPEVANRRTVVAAMIETREGFENREAIMSVEGVDAIYVGPSDLGLTHGYPPTLSPPTGSGHEKLILEILECCERHGVVSGIHADGVATARRWRDVGFQMIAIASDGALLRQAADSAVAAVREVSPSAGSKGSVYA